MAQSPVNQQDYKEMPIFKLMKAFKLQQYAKKLADKGYGIDIYKLALLKPKEQDDLISSLNVLPGHRAKLNGFFAALEELYPRDFVKD